MRTLVNSLERVEPTDPYYNYCWWPYRPVAPTAEKLRAVNVLYHSFAMAGIEDLGRALVHHVRASLGLARTVWGIKWDGRDFAWEFYFYDYARLQRKVSVTRVTKVLEPFLTVRGKINETLPYFMFSLDLTPESDRAHRLTDVHAYFGNPSQNLTSGISYRVGPDGMTMENLYQFFRGDERDAIEAKVSCSPFWNPTVAGPETAIDPAMFPCHTVCIANKKQCDTAYFSGVHVRQVLHFLMRADFPAEFTGFWIKHHHELDHLLFDVGWDYRQVQGSMAILKAGVYSVF